MQGNMAAFEKAIYNESEAFDGQPDGIDRLALARSSQGNAELTLEHHFMRREKGEA
jgi:hypothetical protein